MNTKTTNRSATITNSPVWAKPFHSADAALRYATNKRIEGIVVLIEYRNGHHVNAIKTPDGFFIA